MRNGYYKPYWDQPDELEHYGVLGMKWGIRRYQNKDGTLTAAGKKRYAGDTPEQIATSERRKAKVIKAAKIGAAIAASAAIAGAGYYGLTHTAAGKAAVAAGSRAIGNLFKPKEMPRTGDYFTIEDGQTVHYKNGVRYTNPSQEFGKTIKENTIKETILKEDILTENIITENIITENIITENIIGETKVSSIPNVSKEYYEELASNSKKNKF